MPSRWLAKRPTKGPTKGPTEGPNKGLTKGLTKGPAKGANDQVAKSRRPLTEKQNRIPFGDHPLKLERYRED